MAYWFIFHRYAVSRLPCRKIKIIFLEYFHYGLQIGTNIHSPENVILPNYSNTILSVFILMTCNRPASSMFQHVGIKLLIVPSQNKSNTN